MLISYRLLTLFCISTIQNRIKEISQEMKKMGDEEEKSHAESAQYGQLERKYETLIKEVRNLEGQLADYNLSMDKFRTSTEPEEVKFYHMRLREENQKEAADIDRIFILKKVRLITLHVVVA
jgi:intraflagellar transport protein 74